jgi:hypothetical protein
MRFADEPYCLMNGVAGCLVTLWTLLLCPAQPLFPAFDLL